MSVGDLVIGWLLLRQAEVATDALAGQRARDDRQIAGPEAAVLGAFTGSAPARAVPARDRAFYEGKVATARWFVANVLPELSTRLGVLQATDLDLMDLPEDAF